MSAATANSPASRPAESLVDSAPSASTSIERTTLRIVWAISAAHMLNDVSQSLLPALYPLLKETLKLSFGDVGLITFTFQVIGSLLQPVIGLYTDRRPKPYALVAGMAAMLMGLVTLSQATGLNAILVAAAFIGVGSAVFHPEASRMAHMAAGRRHGLSQALFQVGGNFGTSLGPLLAAWFVVPNGQKSIAWFALAPLAGMVVLTRVGTWYTGKLRDRLAVGRPANVVAGPARPSRQVAFSIAILVALVISKYVYLVSFTNYYTFYLIDKFHVSVAQSQTYLFVFLFAIAAGTVAGGPIGDRFGRKLVIWGSILGVAPFSLVLPHVNLLWTVILSSCAGVILASAFSAILVYAQELIPGRVGAIAGLFFGFAFGVSGIASATLGNLADRTSIEYVFNVCAYLPLIGLLAAFLPSSKPRPQPT
jgi:FSR family fosmidomycin resistance protein-like MFS transporter